MSNVKVLCFTTSYKRHKMLRGTINDIKNQSYPVDMHSINVASDVFDFTDYSPLYDDVESDNCKIVYNINGHQHKNYINAITAVDYSSYDLFIKIDDDDIYKKEYVKTIVDYFKQHPEVDVVSSKISLQLNGDILRLVNANNLGGNPENCDFKMPPTFAFNRKAANHVVSLSNIYGFEDHMWRDAWCANCNIAEINNQDNIIWNIHGQNISTSDFLIK